MAATDTRAFPGLALVAIINPAMRTLCREALQEIGFTVVDGIESDTVAVAGARERHPDVIILSDQLSDVPATEAVRWLRSNHVSATSPIIILGGPSNMMLLDDHRLTILPRPNTHTQLRDALARIFGPPETSAQHRPSSLPPH